MRGCIALFTAMFAISAMATDLGAEPQSEEPEAEEQTPVSVKDFFREGRIWEVALNALTGKVAYTIRGRIFVGDPVNGYHQIAHHTTISTLMWTGRNVLMVQPENRDDLRFYELAETTNGLEVVRTNRVPHQGYVVDPLLESEYEVLYADFRLAIGKPATEVLRIYDVFESDSFRWLDRSKRVGPKSSRVLYWFTDQEQQLVAGIGPEPRTDQPAIWAPDARGHWRPIWKPQSGDNFRALGANRQTLWGLSNEGRDTMALVAFDLETAQTTDTLFESAAYDVAGADVSVVTGEPTTANLLIGGKLTRVPLAGAPPAEPWTQAEPGTNLILQRTFDNSVAIVFSASDTNPGEYYECHKASSSCTLLAENRPWLKSIEFAPMVQFETMSSQGLEIESYLTLPAGEARLPLIVMPHGGPIGVRDFGYFAPDAQWFAWNGFAVLQTNYRGSTGFGRNFRESGLRELGLGIEDDIEAALDDALQRFPQLDPSRVCIFGSSYGGYSAVYSLVRAPDRYRCAASFAGVMDLTLLFNSFTVRTDDALTRHLERMLGERVNDRDALMDRSPVYRYTHITKPVFLAHGDRDSRVDIEHAWRMKRMLELSGSAPEFHVFDGVGHGFGTPESAEKLYVPLVEFLKTHLQPNAEDQDPDSQTGEQALPNAL